MWFSLIFCTFSLFHFMFWQLDINSITLFVFFLPRFFVLCQLVKLLFISYINKMVYFFFQLKTICCKYILYFVYLFLYLSFTSHYSKYDCVSKKFKKSMCYFANLYFYTAKLLLLLLLHNWNIWIMKKYN